MMRYVSPWILLGTMIPLGLLAGAALLAQDAQTPQPGAAAPRDEAAADFRFRRILVPEDRIPEFAGQGYFPMIRRDFEQLTQLLRRDAEFPQEADGAAVRSGEYYAALIEGEFLRGSAVLEIDRRRPGAAAVPLTPLNLAISSPYWKETNTPATAGSDGAGRWMVLARRERMLAFTWSARGVRDPFGAAEFSLSLPESPIRRLTIDVPQELALEVRGGIVEELKSTVEGEHALDLAPPDPGMRRWQVEASGSGTLVLRAAPRTAGAENRTVALQQTSVYDLLPEGVTLAEELRLFVRGAPLREIWLRLPEELRLTTVRLNDRAVAYETSADDPGLVVLRFPEPVVGDRHLVRLSARTPLVLNRSWRLPAVRVQDVAWRAGQVNLRVAGSLAVDQVSPQDCVHSQTAPLASGDAGHSLTFRSYSPQASLSLVVSRRPSQIRVAGGTSLQFGPASASATTVFHLEALEGEQFRIAGELAPEWIIDSVTADADPDEHGDLPDLVSFVENTGQDFIVRLKEPLRARRPVRLTVQTHRRLSGETPALLRPDLRAVELRDVEETVRYVALDPEDPFQVLLTGDRDLTRLNPRELPAAAAALVTAASAGVVFEDSGSAPGVRAQLLSATPSLSANIAVEVSADQEGLQEKYRIHVTPVSSRIDRLHVHFSQRREQALAWRWEEAPEQNLSARRIEEESAQEGETWELTFDRPRDAVFTLAAERAVEFRGPVRLALPSLPQANSQEGELQVRVASGSAIELRTEGMRSAPLPPALPEKYSSLYGVYRFDPAQQPAASVQLLHDPARERGAWAWRCRVTSRYPADGPSHHTAEYELENAGRDSVLVALPLGAILRRVEVNGAEVPLTLAALRANATPIALPDGARFPRLKIEYVVKSQKLVWRADLTLPAPMLDVPVVSREWSVWTAPGIAAATVDTGLAIHREDASWDKRLFGPLRPGAASFAFPSEESDLARRGPRPSGEESAPAGWSAHRMDVSATAAPTLTLYRKDAVELAAAALFVLATVTLAWLSARRTAWLWLAGAAAAAFAILAPSPVYLLGTALFLSVPAAAVMRLAALRPLPAPLPSAPEANLSTASFPAALLLAALSLASMLCGAVLGQEPPGAGDFQPVVIPVDEQGRVSRRDKYVYLPESLYQRLRQSALRLDSSPRAWLLRSADYEAAFAWGEGASSIECQRVIAELELEVVAAPARIELPLAWRNIGLRADSVRLDGEPISLEWREPEGSLAFAVNATGIVRLSVEIEPRVADDGAERRIEIPILPVADASLKVRYPGRVDAVQTPTVLGSLVRDGGSGELSAELGPADRLTIVWPHAEGRSSPGRLPHVEQLTWLQVQPDALVLDARWKFLAGSAVEELEVLADDNLTPLPSTAPGLAGFTQVRREGRQSLHLQFDQPRTPPFEFQISFLVQGGAGVGRPSAPAIDIQQAATARRSFAVSFDPALAPQGVEVAGAEPLPAAQFRSEWGANSLAPHSAYRIVGEDFSWTAATQLHEHSASADAQCELIYRRDEVRALYKASVDFGKGYCLMLRLAAPASLRVERVAVVESDVDRVEHWARDEAGNIIVFLNGRVAGACQVEIAGRATTPARGRVETPQIELRGADPLATTYHIYRAPDVSLRLAAVEGMAQDETARLGSYSASRGRLEGVLRRDAASSGAARAVVEVSPNRPRIGRKQLVTSLKPGASQWSVDLDLQLQINQGVVDVVRFDLPLEVAGTFEVQPAARSETLDVGRSGRRLLIVRPEAPLAGAARVRITGALRPPQGDSVRAPAIEPLDFGEMPQFVVLPREWQSQLLRWEASGMRAEAIPGAARQEEAASPTVSYRVVNKPNYGAVLRRESQEVGDPQVRLLEVTALLQSADSCFAVARYALDPAGLNQCIFELPPGRRLVHADMDGRAVSPTPLADRRYAFDLERARLPVQLSILYVQKIDRDEKGAAALAAPVLLDVPVQRTLWTVGSAAPEASVRLRDNEITRDQQDALRQRALAEMLEVSSTAAAEQSESTLDHWRLAWAQQWQDENWRLSSSTVADRAACAAFEGPAGSMVVRLSAPPPTLAPERFIAALTAFCMACVLAWTFRRANEAEWLARFSPLVLAVAGVAWWIWLAPGELGWLLAAAGIWLSLGRPVRRTLPSQRSSVATLPVRR